MWHLPSAAWFGFLAIPILLQQEFAWQPNLLTVLATSVAETAAVAFAASRGKHPSWLAYGAIAIQCFAAAWQ